MKQGLTLLKSLETAVGQTEHVIVLFFDIRGFTNFCKNEGDSVNIANFVKRIYIKAIRDYFSDATYFKPTGDGMLIIYKCPSGKETDIVKTVLSLSQKFVHDFPNLCNDDKLVYFKTPQSIGIGISRGSACCIIAKATVIDFSGRPLNMASRLSDIARPSGVVFDESISTCLEKESLTSFKEQNVYLKGVTDKEPLKIYHTPETSLPYSCKKPLAEVEWYTQRISYPLSVILSWNFFNFHIHLKKTVSDVEKIMFKVKFKENSSANISRFAWQVNEIREIYYSKEGADDNLVFKVEYIQELLKKQKLQPETEIKFEIIYPI